MDITEIMKYQSSCEVLYFNEKNILPRAGPRKDAAADKRIGWTGGQEELKNTVKLTMFYILQDNCIWSLNQYQLYWGLVNGNNCVHTKPNYKAHLLAAINIF